MPKLIKGLKLLDIFSIAAGAMVSAGIFLLPGIAYEKCGPSVILAYFLAGLLSIPGVLSIAELVTAMPKAGGGYFFVTRSFGPGVGVIAGILSWLSLIFKTTFALYGLSTYLNLIINVNPQLIGAAICILFLLINYFGVTKAGKIQIIFVIILFIIFIYFIFKGSHEIKITNFVPFMKGNYFTIFSTAGFIFVSYGGLLKVASLAEEVEDSKNLPMGMLLALCIIGIFYTLLVFVTVGVMDPNKLINSLTPISDAGETIAGSFGKILLSIAAIIGFTSAANVGIMSSSRYPFALSKDNLFPQFFTKLSKYKTPSLSIATTGIIIIAGLFLPLKILVEVASISLILTYILANLSIIIMRESKLANYEPQFKTPFYPYLQIIGVISYIFLIIEIGKEALVLTLIFIIITIIFYLLYGKNKKKNDFALLHVIERIINKKITGIKLEKELRKILQERDEIKEDRFDKIIKRSLVFDYQEEISFDKLYNDVAEALSLKIGIKKEILYQLFIEKENKFSSVITDNIAIPHIVVEGENIFEVVLVRAEAGIKYPENKKVKIVFILVGSLDERNFHLKALSAIAQIINSKNFEEKWLTTKDSKVLKDIILTVNRTRFKD